MNYARNLPRYHKCNYKANSFFLFSRQYPYDNRTGLSYQSNQRFLSLKHSSSIPQIAKLNDALQLFDQMLQRQPQPSIVEFTRLITVIVKMEHYSTALSLFKKLYLLGISSDLYAMSISINCYC